MKVKLFVACLFIFESITAFAISTSASTSSALASKKISSSSDSEMPIITNEAEYARFQKQRDLANTRKASSSKSSESASQQKSSIK